MTALFPLLRLWNFPTFDLQYFGLGAKSHILSSVAPKRKKKLVCYFQSGTCIGTLETHVFLVFYGQFSVNDL